MRIRSLGLLVMAGLLVVLTAETASAIPAFARKYQTSCHTCHIAYPKLNSFGNAFRLRGYRMPDETEDMIREEPVPLGVDAYKRVWPDAIWPSDIPGTVPLSVDVRAASVTQHDAEADETIKNDLRFPEEVELLAGGTLGETLSFFTSLGFAVESEHGETSVDVEMGHAELHFNGPLGSGTAFNAKFGRLGPEVTQAFNHGYLLTASMPAAMFGFNPVGFHGSTEVAGLGHAGGHGGGGGGISLPQTIEGIEVYGIVGHRFEYSGGISNGIGPGDAARDGNGAKDVFGRIGYKIGGLSLDGEEGLQNEKNWRENSLRVGLFGYRGDGGDILFQGTGHHASSFVEDEEFTRVGVDANVYWRDLNVIFGFVRGSDRQSVFDIPEDEHGEEEDEHGEEPADEHGDEHGATGELVLRDGFPEDFTYRAWFAEADYVFYPWLHGAFRYEWLDPSRPGSDKFERVTANGTVLVRANVKALLEWQRNLGGDAKDDYAVRAALRFAF